MGSGSGRHNLHGKVAARLANQGLLSVLHKQRQNLLVSN